VFESCGVCKGHGEVLVIRSTAGPTQVEQCSNCGGPGRTLKPGSFTITFRRDDELPPARWKKNGRRYFGCFGV